MNPHRVQQAVRSSALGCFDDAPRKEFLRMLHDKMIISAVAALLACTACDQPMDQTAQRDQQSQSQQAAVEQPTTDQQPAPSAMDQDTSTAASTQAASIPLSDVQNPQQTLISSQVKDSKGEAIGEVKSVALNPEGKVQMVTVDTGSRTVALEADGLMYAQAQNTVITQKSKSEIDQAPASPTTP
jgi:hypothetical protein